MRQPVTLSWYIGRHFLGAAVAVLLGLAAVVMLFDVIELLRRTASKDDVSLDLVLQMALLKMPFMAQTVLPFSVLIGAMMAFWHLTRNLELVIARAIGVSAWQFLFPAVALAFLLGVLQVTILNPVASAMIASFDQLEAKHIRGQTNLLAVSENGLWLRQSDGNERSILHARRVGQDDMRLGEVTIYEFEGDDDFVRRIDAAAGDLVDGHWVLEDAAVWQAGATTERHDSLALPTDMTLERIQDSFAAPETMSFWELPAFIDILERAGFSGKRHRLYWHSLLAVPFLLCSMVLVGAACSLRLPRRGGILVMAASGLGAGFLFYFASDLIHALGLSGRIPPELAAWTPAAVSALLGVAVVLHLEDG